jgi:hypothetical protein
MISFPCRELANFGRTAALADFGLPVHVADTR